MTNKPVLRSVEDFMAGYTPVYQPLYTAFLGKSQAYSQEAGLQSFRRVEAVGDIRQKIITPKDTEIKQISVQEGSKTFKKYFLANQFTLSRFQDRQGVEDVNAQVLDEHQKQMDDLLITGGGENNGLYTSSDANYVLESSGEVAQDANDEYLAGLHTDVMANVADAELLSGRKLIIFYGSNIIPLFDSIYSNGTKPFKSVLQEVLGPSYSLAKMPAAVTPNSAHGWIIVNLDQVKMHYTALPQLMGQGINEEKMYYWSNFLMGSVMLEVLASGAIIRQPATLQA